MEEGLFRSTSHVSLPDSNLFHIPRIIRLSVYCVQCLQPSSGVNPPVCFVEYPLQHISVDTYDCGKMPKKETEAFSWCSKKQDAIFEFPNWWKHLYSKH